MQASSHTAAPPPQDIASLQALRAGACLMVVLYHAVRLAAGPCAVTDWPNLSAGVDVFFTLSGFVMVTSSVRLAGRPDGWRAFAWRRICRIVPLYWLLTAVKLGVVMASPALTPHTRPDSWNVLASFLFIPARDILGDVRPILPVGWTLNFEALFYLVFTLALACRIKPLILVTPILGALTLAGFYREANWPAPLFLANGMVLEFCAGMAIGTLWLRGFAVPRWVGWALLLVGSVLLITAPLAGPWRFLVWGIPAACILLGCLTLDRGGAAIPRPILELGAASYAIYLVHPLVLPALGPLVGVSASLAAGWLLHIALDRPLQRWLRPATARCLTCAKASKARGVAPSTPIGASRPQTP